METYRQFPRKIFGESGQMTWKICHKKSTNTLSLTDILSETLRDKESYLHAKLTLTPDTKCNDANAKLLALAAVSRDRWNFDQLVEICELLFYSSHWCLRFWEQEKVIRVKSCRKLLPASRFFTKIAIWFHLLSWFVQRLRSHLEKPHRI